MARRLHGTRALSNSQINAGFPIADLVRAGQSLVRMGLLVSLGVTGWAAAPNPTKGAASGAEAAVSAAGGIASYYGKEHHGKKTANGEIFDMNKLTAAHRSLPFGSTVKVTNLANNRTVIVRINDRGPYVRGRIIDLSLGAARQLDMVEVGITQVKLEVLDRSPAKSL
jgi:rare lipoprotein A